MFSSDIYSYINILDKAADAASIRETAISNNIANIDTPGYKRQDVDFEGTLEQVLQKTKYGSLDNKVKDIRDSQMGRLNVEAYTDSPHYSYRLDKNNVDPEQESAELASIQIRYSALIDSMGSEFSRIKTVIK